VESLEWGIHMGREVDRRQGGLLSGMMIGFFFVFITTDKGKGNTLTGVSVL
jgi:hypothetical protein